MQLWKLGFLCTRYFLLVGNRKRSSGNKNFTLKWCKRENPEVSAAHVTRVLLNPIAVVKA